MGGSDRISTTEFEQFEGAAPPMEMGVRVYLPAVGRFLQVDPIDGGSANDYEYALQDPVNLNDLDGRCVKVFGKKLPCPEVAKKSMRKAGKAARWMVRKGKQAWSAGKRLVKVARGATGISWAACFGWKLSAASRESVPSARQVGRIAMSCTPVGFVLE
ncbi:RHS repeat domain-containing protein [Conexibacter arvalis]|uniref:RHS repeat-associated protein n=1 Tax=Conexibacter arvalis TaxID=912552 RepID=A0A840IDU1_9ACTN|nr:RHS repeat-associated core domain-containing protein [Conexibacter arvalis]MBB4662198.1 RHS repeat-associated protein [Conexibacter arvalis]